MTNVEVQFWISRIWKGTDYCEILLDYSEILCSESTVFSFYKISDILGIWNDGTHKYIVFLFSMLSSIQLTICTTHTLIADCCVRQMLNREFIQGEVNFRVWDPKVMLCLSVSRSLSVSSSNWKWKGLVEPDQPAGEEEIFRAGKRFYFPRPPGAPASLPLSLHMSTSPQHMSTCPQVHMSTSPHVLFYTIQ